MGQMVYGRIACLRLFALDVFSKTPEKIRRRHLRDAGFRRLDNDLYKRARVQTQSERIFNRSRQKLVGSLGAQIYPLGTFGLLQPHGRKKISRRRMPTYRLHNGTRLRRQKGHRANRLLVWLCVHKHSRTRRSSIQGERRFALSRLQQIGL